MKRFIKKFYLALVLLFLYLPIAVLIVQSFNAGKSRAKWEGFSFRWYQELFRDEAIMKALYITLAVAVIAAIAATILGTLAAIGIHAMKKRHQRVNGLFGGLMHRIARQEAQPERDLGHRIGLRIQIAVPVGQQSPPGRGRIVKAEQGTDTGYLPVEETPFAPEQHHFMVDFQPGDCLDLKLFK